MYEIPFPNPDEMQQLKKLATYYKFHSEEFIKQDFIPFFDEEAIEISTWVRILAQRLHEINFSYIMSSYYYERGIPDEPYYDRETNKYFPEFTSEHWTNKEGFEFYSEVFLFKTSSALDTMAHILSINFDMKWDGRMIYFGPAVQRLKSIDSSRFNKLNAIIISDNFKEIKILRNNSAHNISPGQVDSGIYKDKNGLIISSLGRYTNVSKRYELMTAYKVSVFEIVNLIKQTSH